MKKILGVFIAFLSLFVALSIALPNANAAEITEKKEKNVNVKKEDAFYDPSIGKKINAFKIVDGNLEPMSEEEYLAIEQYSEEQEKEDKNKDKQEEKHKSVADKNALIGNPFTKGKGSIKPSYILWYLYFRDTASTLIGPINKSSATVNCNVKSCTITKTINTTYSENFTAGLTLEAKKAIKANAGFTWATSASNSSAYSFTLSKGDYGYLGFKPYYKRTTGTLQTWYDATLLESKSVIGRAPKVLNNELDGVYTFVYL